MLNRSTACSRRQASAAASPGLPTDSPAAVVPLPERARQPAAAARQTAIRRATARAARRTCDAAAGRPIPSATAMPSSTRSPSSISNASVAASPGPRVATTASSAAIVVVAQVACGLPDSVASLPS